MRLKRNVAGILWRQIQLNDSSLQSQNSMSLLELGPIVFGGVEGIITYVVRGLHQVSHKANSYNSSPVIRAHNNVYHG